MKNRVYRCSVCVSSIARPILTDCTVDVGKTLAVPEVCISGDGKPKWEELNSKLIKHEITQKEYDEEAEKLDEHFNPKNYRGKRF